MRIGFDRRCPGQGHPPLATTPLVFLELLPLLLCFLLKTAGIAGAATVGQREEQLPLSPSEPHYKSSSSATPYAASPSSSTPPHTLSLRLNHVLHRSSSAFGSTLLQKTVDDSFLASAREASATSGWRSDNDDLLQDKKTGSAKRPFAYNSLVDGNGAEVGFDHSVRVKSRKRESAFQKRSAEIPDPNSEDNEANDLLLPDPTDKETVLSLARMCVNAYLEVGSDEWIDLGKKVMTNSSFGWTEDGLRGYVFSDASEKLIVLAIKGTTLGTLLDIASMMDGSTNALTSAANAPGGVEDKYEELLSALGIDTVARDKLNDNLLFSCCCARVSWTWTPVCGCYQGGNKCGQNCVEDSLVFEDSYYQMALDLYVATAKKYPHSTIWLTGHSLGGAIASLTALTFGAPSMSFDAPGDLLPARRLHLPMHPGYDMNNAPHWSVGHTADPVFMGSCTGISSCTIGGYALESKCHIGQSIVYDTVGDRGWRVDIRNHRMKDVLTKVLESYDNVPVGNYTDECVDCSAWEYA